MSYDPSGTPFDHNGQTYVALSPHLKKLGGHSDWDNASKAATLTLNGKTAVLLMADDALSVGGVRQPIGGPALLKDDVMYVPASFFRDVFNESI